MALAALAEDGLFAPARIAAELRTTREDLAESAGLGRDAVMRKDRLGTPRTQRRLREMVEVLNKAAPRMGSLLMAYAWYRSEPLPGLDGWTAMQLLRDGRATEVLELIDAVDAGIHA